MNQSYSKRHQILQQELSNVGRLHFKSDNLEDDFFRNFKESKLFRQRIASIIGVVVLLVFMVQDLAVFTEASKPACLIIRAGICIPFFIVAFLVSLMPSMQRQYCIQDEINELRIPHAASTVSDYVSVSGGVIYFVPSEPMSNNRIFQVVDKALYAAKNSGRDQFKIINGIND